MAAILKSAQKGGSNLKGVNILIIDQWGPLNKMIPLMEDPGGGGGGAERPWTEYTGFMTR